MGILILIFVFLVLVFFPEKLCKNRTHFKYSIVSILLVGLAVLATGSTETKAAAVGFLVFVAVYFIIILGANSNSNPPKKNP